MSCIGSIEAEAAAPCGSTGSTLVHLLDRACSMPGTGLRLLDRRGRGELVEWREICRGACEVAGALRNAGIERGQRVALVYPTSLELFHALFGAQLAGAVPVPLYPPVRLGRLEEYHARTAAMLGAVSARLVLADARVRRLLGPTIEKAHPPRGCRTLTELISGADQGGVTLRASEAAERAEPGELALVQFSSGTTVAPKPVALSHRAILAQVHALNSHWPDDTAAGVRHTGVSWLPLYHDMGLIGCVFPALERPSVLTLLGPEVFVARPHLWLRAISEHRATISVAPNFAYGLCVEKIRDQDLDGVDLSSWRVALNGAEPVSPEVLRAFQDRFAPWGFRPQALTPVYGLSEATLAVTFSRLDHPFHALRFDREALARGEAKPSQDGREMISVGRPVPGTSVEIRSDSPQGKPSEAFGGRDGSPIGRVWVRGPSLMEGYLDRPEATSEALVDGWLDTGDLGFLHEGELFLVGRAKDVVLVHGRNHSPDELEHAVDGLEGLRTGCAVAVSFLPEGAAGEELHLFVEHRRGASTPVLEVLPRRVAEAVLGACGVRPREVHVLAPGTLPRTSSGKLRRGETLRRHLAGELTPPAAMGPWRLAKEMLRSSLALGRSERARAAEVGSPDP